MDLHSLKNEGWTNTEIAEEWGYHPATVAKWLTLNPPVGFGVGGGGVLAGVGGWCWGGGCWWGVWG